MRTDVEIRPARASDADAVERMLAACDLPEAGVRGHIEAAYVVATQHGDVVGVAGIEVYGRYGLLRSVAVTPGSQNSGIGRALVEERLGWARSRRLEEVFLLTTDAAAYFERLGFSQVGRDTVPDEIRISQEFASVCPESTTVMVKAINPPV